MDYERFPDQSPSATEWGKGIDRQMTFPIPKDIEELRVYVDGNVVEAALTMHLTNRKDFRTWEVSHVRDE